MLFIILQFLIYIEVNDIEKCWGVIFFNCVVEKPEYASVEKKRQKKGKIIKCFKDIEINVPLHCVIYIENSCKLIIMMKIFGKVKTQTSTNKI